MFYDRLLATVFFNQKIIKIINTMNTIENNLEKVKYLTVSLINNGVDINLFMGFEPQNIIN